MDSTGAGMAQDAWVYFLALAPLSGFLLTPWERQLRAQVTGCLPPKGDPMEGSASAWSSHCGHLGWGPGDQSSLRLCHSVSLLLKYIL